MSRPMRDRSCAALARELREVAGILADLADVPPLHLSLSVMPDADDLDDAVKVELVDAVATALLGYPGVTMGDHHSRHGSRGGLYVGVQARLVGLQADRERSLKAEVARLRAENAALRAEGGGSDA